MTNLLRRDLLNRLLAIVNELAQIEEARRQVDVSLADIRRRIEALRATIGMVDAVGPRA